MAEAYALAYVLGRDATMVQRSDRIECVGRERKSGAATITANVKFEEASMMMRERLKEQWLREIESIDLRSLIERHPTAYLYSSRLLDERCRALRAALPRDIDIYYSLKANPNVRLARRISRHIEGAEVSSAGEMAAALAAGFAPERILLVGPAKTPAEINEAVRLGVRALVIESVDELAEVAEAARLRARPTRILLRVNPQHKPKGAKLTMTGVSSQFGLDAASLPEAMRVVASGAPWLRLEGFHVYLGTRFLDAAQIAANTEHILDLCFELERAYGMTATTLDIGGGLGVPYFEGEPELNLVDLGRALANVIGRKLNGRRLRFILETGRYLVAEAGLYAAKVRYVKKVKGESWIIAHGGINHFYAGAFMGQLLRRNFPMIALTTSDPRAVREVNVCGPLCTPGDLLGSKLQLPGVGPGDVVGILCAGAYAFSTAPQLFLSHDAPAEFMIDNGTVYTIRPARAAEDVLAEQLNLDSPTSSTGVASMEEVVW